MMTAIPTQCPPAQRLQDYALGRLPDEDSDAVFEHLAGCEACASELDTIDDGEDSLIASLRKPDELADFSHEPNCKLAVSKALDALTDADMATQLPQQIGEYEIVRPLGGGGMGSVYLARHTKLGREVALKVLATHRLADPRMQSRFESEMRAVGRLSHPNIVTAHDAREIEGTAVLVTEFIDGRDLGQLVDAGGPLSTSDACEIVRLVAVAMQYTHEQGFVHRDIKPSNIMLSRAGEVKLLDLGIARFQFGDPDRVEITGTGQAMGTADYIAPEQVTDSRSVDIRADIYALGCTLMKLLTGAAPFADAKHQTPFAKMTAHVSTPPPRLTDLRPSVPKELASLVDSMLQKDPARRPQTPIDVAQKLTKLCNGNDLASVIARLPTVPSDSQASSPSKPSQPPATRQLKGLKRRVPLAAAIASGFLGMMLGVALGVIITVKYPDGSTVKLDVPVGSQISVDHQADGTSDSATAPDPVNALHGMPAGTDPFRFAILLDRGELSEEELAASEAALSRQFHKNPNSPRFETKHGTWLLLADDVQAPITSGMLNRNYGLVSLEAGKNILWKDITGHVVDSELNYGGQGGEKLDRLGFSLRLDFDAKLARQMEHLTVNNLEKHLAIAINDKVMMSPRIKAAISTSAEITGQLTREELSFIQHALHPPATAGKAALEEQSSNAASHPFRGIWAFATNVRRMDVTELVAITEHRFYVLDGAMLKDFGTISVTTKDGKSHIVLQSMQSKNAQGDPIAWTGSYQSQSIGPPIVYQFINANNAPDFLKSLTEGTVKTPAGK
ncbi:MAG: protein kinase, partial [Pirellulaceae bacterium]